MVLRSPQPVARGLRGLSVLDVPPEDCSLGLAGVSPGAPPTPLGRYDFRVLRP